MDEMPERFVKAGGLLPALAELYLQRKDLRTAIETLRKGADSPLRHELDSLYRWLQDTLAYAYGLRLLPLEAVPEVQRDILFNLPLEKATHFLQRTDYAAAMEIAMDVDFSLGGYEALDAIIVGKEHYRTHPVVTIHLLLVDNKGHALWRKRYRYRSTQSYTIDQQFVLGIPVKRKETRPELYDLLQEAFRAMLQQSNAAP